MSDDGAASPAAVLRSLVARAVDADPASLDGRIEIVERGSGPEGADASEDEPVTPAERLADLVGEADSVVAVVPRFDTDLASRLNASLTGGSGGTNGGTDPGSEPSAPRSVRVVFTGPASDRLSGATGPVVRRALADRGVDAYRHDGESPVAVALADDRALVGLVDENAVAALLWTGDAAVREWAAATCRRYFAAAEPVSEG